MASVIFPKTSGRQNEKNLPVLPTRNSLMAYNNESRFILMNGQESTMGRGSKQVLSFLFKNLSSRGGSAG